MADRQRSRSHARDDYALESNTDGQVHRADALISLDDQALDVHRRWLRGSSGRSRARGAGLCRLSLLMPIAAHARMVHAASGSAPGNDGREPAHRLEISFGAAAHDLFFWPG